MSLVVAIKALDGIVLATDSRRVYRTPRRDGLRVGDRYWTFDGDVKLYRLPAPHSWVATAFVGGGPQDACSTATAIVETAARLPRCRLSVHEYSERLSDVLMAHADGARMSGQFKVGAVVAGYDAGESQGRVFVVEAPGAPEPVEQHPGALGMTWYGTRFFVDGLVPQMNIPLGTMSLARCSDLAEFLIRTSAEAQRFSVGSEGIGGPVDILTVTPCAGARFAQRKAAVKVSPVERVIGPVWPVATVEVPEDDHQPAGYTVHETLSIDEYRARLGD